MINAVGARDYTLVQAITILFVSGFLLINLMVDVLYVLINPRLRRA
jgi:ABC-type dipeptide/oligopeptide/nickel transport system permease component